VFGKRPSELTPEDLSRVVSNELQEGSQMEFKEALSIKGGTAASDPWTEKREVAPRARNELLEEVIAFANSYGGWLLLGVAETKDKPPRAKAINPIPDCAELADRLRKMCRECIDPQLPILEVEGRPMRQDGSGVVVFHVPRSRMAPHRHTATKECYIRRADRTEKMNMREIQDLTLQVERGLAGIERQFQEQRDQFAQRFAEYRSLNKQHAFGLRATLVPLTPIYVDRVHRNGAVTPPAHPLWATLRDGRPLSLQFFTVSAIWRPLVRGTVNRHPGSIYTGSREVHCDGLIEYSIMQLREPEAG
jgi:hypothetical protein